MKKSVFYTELAYILGIITLALGTAFMEKSDFGVSMVVAPAYLLYLKLSSILSFVTFGMAEYTLQAFLLIIMIIILRKFKVSYLFSFVTAVIYGITLDSTMMLVNLISSQAIIFRIVYYIIGLLLGSLGVAFFFHTYIAPEVYELFVKEVSVKTKININKFKTIYDCISCLTGIVMSFAFFGFFTFEGVKIGTVICALINGKIIGIFSGLMDKKFEFKNLLSRRTA